MLQFSRKLRPLCQILIRKCHFWYTIADLDIWSSIETFKTNYCQRHDSLRVECFWHSNYLIKRSTRQLLVSAILLLKSVLFCSFCCFYFSVFPSCLLSPTCRQRFPQHQHQQQQPSKSTRLSLHLQGPESHQSSRQGGRIDGEDSTLHSAEIVLDDLVVWLMGVIEEVDDVVGN